jgi:hypothetical protein
MSTLIYFRSTIPCAASWTKIIRLTYCTSFASVWTMTLCWPTLPVPFLDLACVSDAHPVWRPWRGSESLCHCGTAGASPLQRGAPSSGSSPLPSAASSARPWTSSGSNPFAKVSHLTRVAQDMAHTLGTHGRTYRSAGQSGHNHCPEHDCLWCAQQLRSLQGG